MATSGTTAFNLDLVHITEEAFERAGRELRSGYDLRTARRSLNLILQDWSNRGINRWAIDFQTIVLTEGTAVYSLPTDTIDMLDAIIRIVQTGQQTDYVIQRIAFPQYDSIPNKTDEARPLQYLVNRVVPPTVTLWPVPDGSYSYTLAFYRMRQLQDVGVGGSYTFDIPVRFIPALTSGLAYYIALKDPKPFDFMSVQRLQMLKQNYLEDFQLAADEDREKASWSLVPNPESYRIGR